MPNVTIRLVSPPKTWHGTAILNEKGEIVMRDNLLRIKKDDGAVFSIPVMNIAYVEILAEKGGE